MKEQIHKIFEWPVHSMLDKSRFFVWVLTCFLAGNFVIHAQELGSSSFTQSYIDNSKTVLMIETSQSIKVDFKEVEKHSQTNVGWMITSSAYKDLGTHLSFGLLDVRLNVDQNRLRESPQISRVRMNYGELGLSYLHSESDSKSIYFFGGVFIPLELDVTLTEKFQYYDAIGNPQSRDLSIAQSGSKSLGQYWGLAIGIMNNWLIILEMDSWKVRIPGYQAVNANGLMVGIGYRR
ncbi:MAG: hypothetical protein HQM12_14095 [SAR324 cluster bacterium]|nr:hypothetical protein [SAR324 cluster bacterium]